MQLQRIHFKFPSPPASPCFRLNRKQTRSQIRTETLNNKNNNQRKLCLFVWRRRRRRRRGGRICNSGIDSIPEVTSGIGGTGRREGREKHRRHSGRNGCVYPSAGSGRRRGGGWGERGRRCGILLPLADNFFSTETETGKQERKLTHRQKNDHHSPPLLLLTEKIIKKNSNSFKDNYIQTQGKFRPRKLTISFHYLYFFCWFFVGFFFFFWIIDLNFI